MTRFLLSRLLGAGAVLAVMSFSIFALIGLMPGDPADMLGDADADATPESLARLREIYGFDTPIPVRYWYWVTAALLDVIWPALGNTVMLTGTAFAIAITIAMTLGTVASLRQGSWGERLIGLVSYAGISVPSFWVALMLIEVFAVTLGWLPAGGMPASEDGFRGVLTHLALPVSTLVVGEIGAPTRYVRAAMLDVLGQDYMRTARAKGIPLSRLILRHALRNAMIPVTTVIALGLGDLFSGALLTETVFGWRGMGNLILEAILGNDYNLALVCLLFTTAAILAANILADIAYTKLDPRIALAGARR